MSNSLAELARSTGLPACGRVIAGYGTLPAPSAADASLSQPAARDVGQTIAQLVRRGLQPSAIATLRQAWQGRPLERGLLAWDVLNGALLSDRSLVEELRDDARLVGAVLPEPGHGFVLHRPEEIEQLMDAIATPAVRDLSRDELTTSIPPFGALRADGVTPDQMLLDVIRQYARLLHRAHLPTLASFCLADLYHHHHYQPALRDLVEVLLDQEATDVDSWLSDAHGEDAVELATYVRLRGLNNREQWDEALQFADAHRAALESLELPPAKAAHVNPRPTLAYAEAALRRGRQAVSYEHVAAIAGVEPAWRYAFRVMLTYAATRIKDPSFVTLLATYVEKFGNDVHAWYDTMAVAADDVHWGPKLPGLLTREVLALPHDPAVWKSAVYMLGEDNASDGADEVDARLRAQAKLT